ncbi:MAG: hypothetical protein CSA22_07650 [Deltaproteobacteria bacterium]|nr:MAG: hypothetical protein CSA22_07650 [Deltaproteobacteria bacterium]
MTTNEKLPRFTLGDGKEQQTDQPPAAFEPDALLKKDRQDIKLEKLSTRITFITIIIPCLIGALIVIAYLDTQERMGEVKSLGSSERQTISASMENRIAAVEKTASEQVIAFNKRLDTLATQLSDLNTALSKTEKRLKETLSAKADKKRVEALRKEVTAVSEKLPPLDTRIAAVKTMQAKDQKALKTTVETLQTDLTAAAGGVRETQSRLAALEQTQLSRKDVSGIAEKQTQALRTYIDKTADDLDLQMLRLTGLVNRLTKTVHHLESGGQSVSQPPAASGNIIEKNLNQ